MRKQNNTKYSYIIHTVVSSTGKYDIGTIVMVDGKLYKFEKGNCDNCDCWKEKDCMKKSFSCDKDVEHYVCLKKMKEGI